MDTNEGGRRRRSGIPCVIHNLLVGFYQGDTRSQQLLYEEAADDGCETEVIYELPTPTLARLRSSLFRHPL